MKIIFLALFFAAITATADAKKRCYPITETPEEPVCKRKFEEYLECGPASGCVKTCDKPNGGVCPKICVQGCFCQKGYVRDSRGRCVLLEDCPKPKCRKNEEWTDCNKMCSDAVNRCENLVHPVACRPSGCTSGCICKEGYYRDDNDRCVLKEDCPSELICGHNEEYTECSTLCVEATCEDRTERYCGAGPCQPKCHCKKGYVRNEEGECIKVNKCPANDPCKLPIVVGPCKAALTRYAYDSDTKQCIKFSYGGCDGNANRFHSLEECENTCEKKPTCSRRKHEVYSECGANGCQATCDNPTLPQVCRAVCMAGCICEEGYIRDADGRCIHEDDCPLIIVD